MSAMAYDEELAERIRAEVAGEQNLTEMKMFGGLAFLIGGNMAVAASGQGGLMLRCDPDETEALLRSPARRSSRCAARTCRAGCGSRRRRRGRRRAAYVGRARGGVRAVAAAEEEALTPQPANGPAGAEPATCWVGRTLKGSSMVRGTGSGPAGTGILVVRPLEVITAAGVISKSVTSSSVIDGVDGEGAVGG